ncbi:hypothetical protein GOODEAATRI_003150 [Goodea atripinnis]|uniref:Uncharacterized protein n=1 Tax=Goodea atripinnis TaxID=208336 RepID=A0ABV0PKJ4_9TELE
MSNLNLYIYIYINIYSPTSKGGGDGEQAEGKINISSIPIIIQISLYAVKLRRHTPHRRTRSNSHCVHTLTHLHRNTKSTKGVKGLQQNGLELKQWIKISGIRVFHCKLCVKEKLPNVFTQEAAFAKLVKKVFVSKEK